MRRWMIGLICCGCLAGADFKAGVGRVKITPEGPIWMSGYASRNKPSEGVAHDLWAKALAVQDSSGRRAVIVSVDVIGFPRSFSDALAARLQQQYGLERSALLLNASHTHTGPVIWPNLSTMFRLSPEEEARLKAYAQKLSEDMAMAVGAALADLAPARLAFGQGKAGFAVNRREFTPKGVRIGVNPEGPVDHAVPVVKVAAADGSLKAVLFGYACHNTTLTGEFYELSGDYSGYAQSAVEREHPGSTALFLALCGGDQNPHPRSQAPLAVQHGETLAAEVKRVLGGQLESVRPPIRTAFRLVDLPFAYHTREQFEKEAGDQNLAKARRADLMLKAYAEGRPVRRVPYPVQAIRFHQDLTLVALGGEVVVGYALRTKREFPKERLVVAGYSNDVMCYIPTAQVLSEGGYEAVDSMVYYGQPGPFNQEVEETVMGAIRQVLERVGARR